MLRVCIACCALAIAPAALAENLSFSEAVDRASADGPTIEAGRSALEAARLRVAPADELPDPKLVLGVRNIPVSGADQFTLDRDFMSRTEIGVMQEVPNRAKRMARAQRAEAGAEVAGVALEAARLEAKLSAARAWVDAFYSYQRLELLDALAIDVESLAQTAEDALASAAGTADDAIATRLARSRIDDRKALVDSQLASARAELERWIGDIGDARPGPLAPTFEIDPSRLREHVIHHVAVARALAEMSRAEADLDLARAGRHSDWSWDVMYGRREPSFSDMVSVGVTFSLPLFQSRRQSPLIGAQAAELGRARAEREAVLLQHRAHLDAMLAEYASINERLDRLNAVQLPLVRQRAELSRAGFAAGDGSVADAIRARIEVLEMNLERIGLEEQAAQLGASLALEHGEGLQ